MHLRKRLAVSFAATMLVALTVAPGIALAADVQHGIGFTKGCTSPTKVGDPYACSYTVRNVLDEAQDTLTIDSLVDTVHSAGGDVNSGNIIGSVQITTTTIAGGLTPSGSSCAAAAGTGTTANPYTGVTSCTLPFGSRLNILSSSHYTVQAADFALPNHQLKDNADLGWHDLCNDPALTGNQNCNVNPPSVGSASLSLIQQLLSTTSTAIHNGAHQTVTTVAAGTTVHDLVTVAGQGGQPNPTGNVNIDWFLNGTCTGAAAANSGSVGPLDANGQLDATGFSFTVTSAGLRAFQAHYEGDARYLPSAGACEPLQVVDANIQITPNGVNRVGDAHVFTGHVNVNDGTGSVNAPDGTQISFTVDSGPGSFTTANPCTTAGGTGSCTISLSSATTGVTTVSAHTTVSVAGVSLSRDTNGVPANSGPATKTWVNAKISIAPNATNEIGQPHTFTATLEKDPGTGTFVAAAGETVTVTLTGANGATPTPAGPFTGTTNASGQFAVTFTSPTPGTVTGHASSTLSVGGSAPFTVATDGTAPNSGDAVKTFVDANIQITPATATNPVGTTHVLTLHVNVDPGTGFVNAPNGTSVTANIQSGPGSFVGSPTCTTVGTTGSCTVTITSAVTGTTVVRGTTTVSVGGLSLTRTTGDGHVGDSVDAHKTWANAAITIAPSATNEVGQPHTFTVTVLNDTGAGLLPVGAGQQCNVTLSNGSGAVANPAGPFNLTTNASGQCAVTFTSASAGTVTGHASSMLTVGGVNFTVQTDGTSPNSGNAVKTFVDANIAITPANANNPVGTTHVLTLHVNVNPGTGFVNAPAGTSITANIQSGPGSFVGSPTCTTVGTTGSCTVTITSATTGTTVVRGTTTVSVGGLSLTRTTGDSHVGDTANANKNWAAAAVTTQVHNPTHQDITGTTVAGGTVVHDQATVSKAPGTPSGVPAPTGTVTFTLYNTGTCTGTVVATSANVALGTESATFTTPISAGGGSFSYLAHYNGDVNYPAANAACEPFSLSLASGRVTGGGSIFATINGVPNVRVTHGFELRCDPNDKRQSLEINWDGGNNFHLDKIINSVICFDDPTTQPPPPPGTVIDTYAGNTLFNGSAGYHGFGYAVGTGTCNKQPATIYFILIDAGEPGTADTAEYHIVSSGCTLDAGPAQLLKGNHQFHKQ